MVNTCTWAADRARRVFEFTFSADGQLKPAREFDVAPEAKRSGEDFIGDVAVSPDGQIDLRRGSVSRFRSWSINPQSGALIDALQDRPASLSDSVSSRRQIVFRFELGGWHGVSARRRHRRTRLGRIRLGPHTTDMVLSDRKIRMTDKDATRVPPVCRGGEHQQRIRGERERYE